MTLRLYGGHPAFLTILMMPIATVLPGIVFGMLSYTLLKLFTGRVKEIPIIMYVLSAIFVLRFFI